MTCLCGHEQADRTDILGTNDRWVCCPCDLCDYCPSYIFDEALAAVDALGDKESAT